jgi:hypothetical protein
MAEEGGMGREGDRNVERDEVGRTVKEKGSLCGGVRGRKQWRRSQTEDMVWILQMDRSGKKAA